ncbi:MAG: hypothetical protein ACR2GY_06260 [Phycisphaerales bacterium]
MRAFFSIIAVLMLTAPVQAQGLEDESLLFPGRDFDYFEWLGQPTVTAQQLREAVAEIDTITDAQQTLIRSIYDDFHRNFHEQATVVQPLIARARANRGPDESGRAVWQREVNGSSQGNWTPRTQLEWETQRHKLESELLADVGAVLSPDQYPKWQSIASRIRREKWQPLLHLGYPYPQGDIIRIVASLELPSAERALIEPVLREYESEVDAMLQRMERDRARLQVAVYELRDNRDPESAQRRNQMLAQQEEMALGHVRINVLARDKLIAALPAEYLDAFRDAYGLAMHPNIYAPSPADRLIAGLGDADWLSPGSRERVDAVVARYRPHRRAILNQLETSARQPLLDPTGWLKASETYNADLQAWRLQVEQAGPDQFMVFELPESDLWRDRFNLACVTVRQIIRALEPQEREQLSPSLQLVIGVAGE